LSIVDHNDNSNQPFVSNCGRYTIVFNGEVYNHSQIREKLKDKYSFKTVSDTEAILYAYIEYGEKCLDEFRGMFAFAIYDYKIPDNIINKPKLGLNPPMGIWLKKDLKKFINDYLSKETIEKRGLFNYNYIKQILYEHEINKRDRSLYIWALIVLEEWFRQYVD